MLDTVRAMVDKAGGTPSVAAVLGVSQETVRGWVHKNRVGPKHYIGFTKLMARLGIRVNSAVVLNGGGND